MKLFLVFTFFAISFFIHSITGREEVIPFYSWEMFSSLERDISFFELEVVEDERVALFNSLPGVDDGIDESKKRKIVKLYDLGETQREEVINELSLGGNSYNLYKVEADSLEYYKNRKATKRELVWTYSK